MERVKRCPRCEAEYEERVDVCADCGEGLLWEPLDGGPVRSPAGPGAFPDPLADFSSGGERPPLSPSPDLETVVAVDLQDAKELGARLDRAGIRYRLEMLEPPENSYSASFGIPNESGLYAVRVVASERTRAEAEWEAYLRKTAPGPESDPGEAWSSEAPPPIDRRGSSCLGVVAFLLVLGAFGVALLGLP